jgi:hypothetical protein
VRLARAYGLRRALTTDVDSRCGAWQSSRNCDVVSCVAVN